MSLTLLPLRLYMLNETSKVKQNYVSVKNPQQQQEYCALSVSQCAQGRGRVSAAPVCLRVRDFKAESL